MCYAFSAVFCLKDMQSPLKMHVLLYAFSAENARLSVQRHEKPTENACRRAKPAGKACRSIERHAKPDENPCRNDMQNQLKMHVVL